MNTAINTNSDGSLSLGFVLKGLESGGLISGQQAAQLKSRLKNEEDEQEHPLVTVADQGWQSVTNPSFPLSLERLTRWLAETSSQEYFRIDPLKIDMSEHIEI